MNNRDWLHFPANSLDNLRVCDRKYLPNSMPQNRTPQNIPATPILLTPSQKICYPIENSVHTIHSPSSKSSTRTQSRNSNTLFLNKAAVTSPGAPPKHDRNRIIWLEGSRTPSASGTILWRTVHLSSRQVSKNHLTSNILTISTSVAPGTRTKTGSINQSSSSRTGKATIKIGSKASTAGEVATHSYLYIINFWNYQLIINIDMIADR